MLYSNISSGGHTAGSSNIPASNEICNALSSLDQGLETVALTGISYFAANSIASFLPLITVKNSSSLQGAITFKSGARAAAVNSKRTWSLPLPVAPCAK